MKQQHKSGRLLPWLIGTKHFPESKNTSQNPKHFPESKTLLDSGKCLILGSVLDSGGGVGSAFGFRDVFFVFGTCFRFWEVFCPYVPP